MLSSPLLILLVSAGIIEASPVHDPGHTLSHLRLRASSDSSTGLTLLADAVQQGSFNNGRDELGANEVGQALSATSQNNFINNCAGKTLTNGLQITTGSCNGITMGDIPAKASMVSSIITFPTAGSANIESGTTFNITVQMSNLVAGSFTNADATYYAAPQTLSGGLVVGHTHVTVQDLGANLNPTTAPDATLFAFFKGINDPGNGKGLLTATVTGGLPPGNYRVCTLASSSNHQPVLMPVAQRGSADDCTKFTVIGNNDTINADANDGSAGIAAASLAAAAVAAGPNVAESTAASAAASSVADTSTADSTTTTADSTTTTADSTTTTSVSDSQGGGGRNRVTTTTSSDSSTSTNKSSHGSGSGKGSGESVTKEIITIIETFFEFAESALGGAVPPVGKSGEKFSVFDELFDDLSAAAGASCGHQFTTCQALVGPGFSIDECVSQQDSCSSAASTQSATATTPATVTATQVLPVTASATIGSAIATSTVSSSVAAVTSASSAPAAVAQAVGTSSAEQCSVVTVTATAAPTA